MDLSQTHGISFIDSGNYMPYGIWIDTETGWWFQTLIYFPFHIWENPDKIDELHDFSEG